MDHNPEQFAALQSQFQEMQNVLRQQAEIISGLTAAACDNQQHQHTPPNNSLATEVLKQFVKSPIKFYKEVNPRSLTLSFDGSDYSEWETSIDRALQHAFVRDKSFLNDTQDNFQLLDLIENKTVTMLMRSTLDNALLSIVESHEISLSKELFELLKSKCQRSG
jgi:hypothetical protein